MVRINSVRMIAISAIEKNNPVVHWRFCYMFFPFMIRVPIPIPIPIPNDYQVIITKCC